MAGVFFFFVDIDLCADGLGDGSYIGGKSWDSGPDGSSDGDDNGPAGGGSTCALLDSPGIVTDTLGIPDGGVGEGIRRWPIPCRQRPAGRAELEQDAPPTAEKGEALT